MSEEYFEELQKTEIEELKAKIAELEAQLKEKQTAEEETDEACEEKTVPAEKCSVDEITAKVRESLDELCKEMAPLIEKCKEGRKAAEEAAKEKIEKHPVVAAAVAFGFGFILAKIVRNKVCACCRK